MTYHPDPARRVAARERLLRRRRALTSGLTIATLGATGAVAGLLAKPATRLLPAAPAAAPAVPRGTAAAAVVPRPRRTVYVRVPATRRAAPANAAKAAPRRAAARPVAPPAPAQAPPATTSSGS
jgi:hypothetical protein